METRKASWSYLVCSFLLNRHLKIFLVCVTKLHVINRKSDLLTSWLSLFQSDDLRTKIEKLKMSHAELTMDCSGVRKKIDEARQEKPLWYHTAVHTFNVSLSFCCSLWPRFMATNVLYFKQPFNTTWSIDLLSVWLIDVFHDSIMKHWY